MKISSHTTRSSADCGPRLLSFVHPTAPEPETATAGPRVPVSPAVSPRVETLLTAVQGTLAELIPRHGSRRLPRLVPVSPAVSRPRQLC